MDGTQAGCDSWFNDPHSVVSAHYSLPKSTTEPPHQYVQETRAAWHAGVRHRPRWPLLPPRMINVNWITLGLEAEGWTGEPWTDYQIGLAVWFLRRFWRDWGIEPIADETVVRHSSINALHGGCPGPGCPFDRIVAEAWRLGPLSVADGFLLAA